MALKFLNKKGWHTGSLRNIENVWKAEQKHEAEQKKLDELRKQIQEERERSEFRQLQEQAGLIPRQERLDFLYDSGLAVGKGAASSSKGEQGVAFKALESSNDDNNSRTVDPSSSSSKQPSAPGALFEDKPHSANDAWRKLHSDPLLMIRQREQEALARIKNNPVQMALIRKSVEAKQEKEQPHDKKERRRKHKLSDDKHKKHSSSRKESDSEFHSVEGKKKERTGSKYDSHHGKSEVGSDHKLSERGDERRKIRDSKYREQSPRSFSDSRTVKDQGTRSKNHGSSNDERHSREEHREFEGERKKIETRNTRDARDYDSARPARDDSHYKRRNVTSKLSEEERAARLREMQADAELHEEQRWKRLKKAAEEDAQEATRASMLSGRNFLDAAKKSVYGADKGGSSTIEESVRRRAHYSQRRSEAGDGNAFRR